MRRQSLTPEERAIRARLGAHAMHARNDGRDVTAEARATFRAGFERQADPDGTLPPEERARRAEHLWKAHMARMAFESSKARRKAKEAKGPATGTDG